MDWQPIETAPFDNQVILIARPGDWVEAAYWGLAKDASGWDDRKYPWAILDGSNGLNGRSHGDGYGPTHWAPLPQPPATPDPMALPVGRAG